MADGEEEKPNIAADGKINLRVRSQNGEQVTFQAKPTTKLSKLMKAYCERQMVDINSVVFSYDGQRLREDQTPGELDMEDNEFIDVLQHQQILHAGRWTEEFAFLNAGTQFGEGQERLPMYT